MENHLAATQEDSIAPNMSAEAKNILKVLDELQDFTEHLRERLLTELRA